MSNAATWIGDLISAGLLVVALVALGTWRAQVLGGRQIQLAEQCLDAARDFSVRIKVVRMEQTDVDHQMKEIQESLLEFQRIFLRVNYYLVPAPSRDIPDMFIRCFATLDTNFRELKRFSFQEPKSLNGDSIEATAVGAQERSRYQTARNTFYGLSDNDPVDRGLIEAEGRLADALRPILNPHGDWFGANATRSALMVCKAVSVTVGVVAALLWLWAASVHIPNAPGAAIGGTAPTDPFNVAMRRASLLNGYAALATCFSVFFGAVAEGIGSWRNSRSARTASR